jgi:ArsR family transcriptional regulator
MGISKSDHFNERQIEVATFAKALSHPARVAILEYLQKVDSCICGDIVNELPLAQPTISQHLKELKLAGIIKGSIEGNTICYCINKDNWAKFQVLIGNICCPPKSDSKTCC